MGILARLIPCFIPVRRVRRRVRKSLSMRAPISRKDTIEMLNNRERVILDILNARFEQMAPPLSRDDVNAMIIAREQAMADAAAQEAAAAAAQKASTDAADREDLHKRYDAIKQEWNRRNDGVTLIPGRFIEYDLVFAIGTGCHVTTLLDVNKLRLFSSPLDWTGGVPDENWWSAPNVWRDSRFREKIDSLYEEFVNYFNPSDLVPITQGVGEHQWVYNMRTKIRFVHFFNTKQSLEQQLPEGVKKMKIRGQRLIDAIEKSDKILICWGNMIADQRLTLDAVVSDEDVLYGVEQLRKKWPNKQFDLVFFEHDGTKAEFEFDKVEVCSGAYRIRSNHFVVDCAYNHVHSYPNNVPPITVIAEALDNIKLTDRLKKEFSTDQGI